MKAAGVEIAAMEDIPPGATPDDLMRFEEATLMISLGDLKRGQELALESAKRFPDGPAPLNNAALAYAMQGGFADAIKTCQQVLARRPDNVHALSNLVQCFVRSGRRDEAKEAADRLRTLTPTEVILATKQMEGFAFLGDDSAVIDLFAEVENAEWVKDGQMPAFYHLPAVAFSRQGNIKRAKQLWEKSSQGRSQFQYRSGKSGRSQTARR